MAISGKFQADFASFYDAVQKAEISLRSFESGSTKVESALNRMVDSFSGRKVIQDATLMAKAVEDIGGVSKLTAAELARIGPVASEAIAKMKAIGVDVPPGIQKVANATSATVGEFLSGIPVLGQFFALFTLDKMAEFALHAIEAAGAIQELHNATGVSTTGLQQLGYVGAGVGVDMETIGRSVEQLSARLSGGDASATRAVGMLGLSIKDLIAAGPQEAFLRIAEATAKVEDPMMRSALATDEFGGRLGKTLLPLLGDLRTKMNEVPKDAIISEANVKAANDFDTALKQLVVETKAWTVSLALVPVHIFDAYAEFFKPISEDEIQAEVGARAFFKTVEGGVGSLANATSNADLFANRLKELKAAALDPLTAVQLEHIISLQKWGESEAEIARLVGTTVQAVHLAIEANREHEAELKRAAAAAEEVAKRYAASWANLAELKAGYLSINPIVAATATEFLRLGASQSDVVTAFNLSAGAVKSLAEELVKATAAQKIHTDQVNAQIIAEFEAQTNLNKAMGLDAAGAIAVQLSALEKYQRKMEEIHKLREEGISQTAQEKQADKELADDLYKDAAPLDALTGKQKALNEEHAKVPAVLAAATDAVMKYTGALWASVVAESSLLRPDTQSRIQAGPAGGNVLNQPTVLARVGSNATVVTVHVAGSVVTERELVNTVKQGLATSVLRGIKL